MINHELIQTVCKTFLIENQQLLTQIISALMEDLPEDSISAFGETLAANRKNQPDPNDENQPRLSADSLNYPKTAIAALIVHYSQFEGGEFLQNPRVALTFKAAIFSYFTLSFAE